MTPAAGGSASGRPAAGGVRLRTRATGPSSLDEMARAAPLRIVPVGDAPSATLPTLLGDLSEILGLPAGVWEDRLVLPDPAFDAHRGQFLAPRVLHALQEHRRRSGGDRTEALVLGVANSDLYAPGLSFVFGQADPARGAAVISLARLYPAFYGRPHEPLLFQRRAAIEGVHEVGHLLGLAHCPSRTCVMFFSSTIADSDRKGPLFCPDCRARADRAVRAAVDAEYRSAPPPP